MKYVSLRTLPMYTQNLDLFLLRQTLEQLCHIVELEIQRQHNLTQDSQLFEHQNKLSEHDHRLSRLEKHIQQLSNSFQDLHNQIQEDEESIDFVISKVRELDHIAGENEDLRSELSFFSPDYEDE
ncbi:hypothetical protein M595_1301 [Lyngbya aestuarii BL J]|uniref:Uncharacterized protein n=1 Tax=Lyngbya aestuarii BL J TaxID=1348334 RepID=U7QNL0_9CYAN|nr:hypothetical protein [Lyngbya aestuarii]ERT08710.1 hypothetical protein M595_1301 [Lyngbya aestuarii BL J]